jgi:SAM-dependent methyltransferase
MAETIYDHPRYYDILFGWDRSKEASFYDRILEARGAGRDEPVLEVACGSGRVARLLAARGRNVTGMDLRPGMLAFLRDRSAAQGTPVATLCADMTSFAAPDSFGGAYNPMNSFRILQTDAAAEAHFACVAAALRPRGVYVLDLDFAASLDDLSPHTDQPWEMTDGKVTVRAEEAGIVVDDDGARRRLIWGEHRLRNYTSATFARRVAAVEGLAIESWHPEAHRGGEMSEWSVERTAEPPIVGRTMVVLRRS